MVYSALHQIIMQLTDIQYHVCNFSTLTLISPKLISNLIINKH